MFTAFNLRQFRNATPEVPNVKIGKDNDETYNEDYLMLAAYFGGAVVVMVTGSG
jgi:hypothetical protein